MKNRRYYIGFDNKYLTGYERKWPKARAIERAEQIVESMGGSAIVARMEHGALNIVHESVAALPTDGSAEQYQRRREAKLASTPSNPEGE